MALIERCVVVRGLNFDSGKFDNFRAEIVQERGKRARLLARARDDNALAEERQLFIPVQFLAQPHDLADDDGGGRLERVLVNQLRAACRECR